MVRLQKKVRTCQSFRFDECYNSTNETLEALENHDTNSPCEITIIAYTLDRSLFERRKTKKRRPLKHQTNFSCQVGQPNDLSASTCSHLPR